jgi:hypothetical protein
MKKITIIIIGLLVLLAFAGTAIATNPTETNKATGGGTFLLRDFKDTIGFTAIQIDDQYDAKGQITIQYRNNEGPEGPGHNLVKVDVTTLVVEGNKAWIAGVITKSFDPSFIGDGLLLEVIDDSPDKLAFGGGDVTPEEARNLALEKFEFESLAPISGSIKVS